MGDFSSAGMPFSFFFKELSRPCDGLSQSKGSRIFMLSSSLALLVSRERGEREDACAMAGAGERLNEKE